MKGTITNDKQYAFAKEWIGKFTESANAIEAEPPEESQRLTSQAMIASYRGEAQALQRDVHDYEVRTRPRFAWTRF